MPPCTASTSGGVAPTTLDTPMHKSPRCTAKPRSATITRKKAPSLGTGASHFRSSTLALAPFTRGTLAAAACAACPVRSAGSLRRGIKRGWPLGEYLRLLHPCSPNSPRLRACFACSWRRMRGKTIAVVDTRKADDRKPGHQNQSANKHVASHALVATGAPRPANRPKALKSSRFAIVPGQGEALARKLECSRRLRLA